MTDSSTHSSSSHGFQLAQVNIGRFVAPADSPEIAGFVSKLEEINALADRSPGFVWRLVDGSGMDAMGLRPDSGDDRLQINCSVWETIEALKDYVYRSVHLGMLARRREWFERLGEAHQAMWWVPAGHRPTVAEAMAKVAWIREHGSSPQAFDFRDPYPAPTAVTGLAG
ncbi:DUF3291 domain-containing protein [Streptomyces sp. YC504]|uniref:DUF3291 domain-containing protein n=1 Tax=Streptomyces mesophilus TaxID=1775132 RepID=A0A6G4XU78_9ACTN|nr:DUF3291 domain-containing protein [Streptomyces mesophilus]NGO80161.1 DUF3291 domain-containing protein [Streptomyces mesophilus]